MTGKMTLTPTLSQRERGQNGGQGKAWVFSLVSWR
jgi:hypothetical protein